jgi:hypothetical protein
VNDFEIGYSIFFIFPLRFFDFEFANASREPSVEHKEGGPPFHLQKKNILLYSGTSILVVTVINI